MRKVVSGTSIQEPGFLKIRSRRSHQSLFVVVIDMRFWRDIFWSFEIDVKPIIARGNYVTIFSTQLALWSLSIRVGTMTLSTPSWFASSLSLIRIRIGVEVDGGLPWAFLRGQVGHDWVARWAKMSSFLGIVFWTWRRCSWVSKILWTDCNGRSYSRAVSDVTMGLYSTPKPLRSCNFWSL